MLYLSLGLCVDQWGYPAQFSGWFQRYRGVGLWLCVGAVLSADPQPVNNRVDRAAPATKVGNLLVDRTDLSLLKLGLFTSFSVSAVWEAGLNSII